MVGSLLSKDHSDERFSCITENCAPTQRVAPVVVLPALSLDTTRTQFFAPGATVRRPLVAVVAGALVQADVVPLGVYGVEEFCNV